MNKDKYREMFDTLENELKRLTAGCVTHKNYTSGRVVIFDGEWMADITITDDILNRLAALSADDRGSWGVIWTDIFNDH